MSESGGFFDAGRPDPATADTGDTDETSGAAPDPRAANADDATRNKLPEEGASHEGGRA